ncbi:DUF4352 domain-containing protein [Streptomyces sp. NPDC086023]|uniref:DUF4352 domain-containing protein n=1 Tax=Streptomyces sp. NPDC086023 TaxID=3365746 RepID=UPI0037D61779
MRIHHAVAALTAAALLTLTGCLDTSIKTKPDAAPVQQPKGGPSAPEGRPRTAAIGDTLTLAGNLDGEKVAVTVKRWVDPAKAKDEFIKPAAGHRYVAAQIQLANVGKAPYNDSPTNGAKVADADGQQFNSTITMGTTAGPEFPATVTIAPGGKALGYIVFEVPKASKISMLHFGLNSGFASQIGQWDIK